jgi:hypothetical protein
LAFVRIKSNHRKYLDKLDDQNQNQCDAGLNLKPCLRKKKNKTKSKWPRRRCRPSKLKGAKQEIMKTTFIKTAFVSAGLIAFGANAAKADVIADWTFETSQPGVVTLPASPGAGVAFTSFSPESGSGTATALHAGAATYSSPAGNGSSHSFSSTLWAVGDYWEFDVSTINQTGIQISFDQASSNFGPGTFGLFYSVNGGSYTQIGNNYTVKANASPNPTWTPSTYYNIYTFTPDLSSLGTALENATTLALRLVDEGTVSANGSTVTTAGTDRVDNFTVTAVPEPVNVALGVFGGMMGLVALARSKPVKRLCGKI